MVLDMRQRILEQPLQERAAVRTHRSCSAIRTSLEYSKLSAAHGKSIAIRHLLDPDLKMVMRADAEIVDPLSEKLAGGRISMEIFHQEQELPAKCLEMVQLNSGPGGHVGIPVILLMVFDVNRRYWPQDTTSIRHGLRNSTPYCIDQGLIVEGSL